MKNESLKAVLLVIGGYSLFSLGDMLSKLLTGMQYSPFQISFAYGLIGMIFLLIFAGRLGGVKASLASPNKKLHLARLVLSAPTQTLNFYAFAHLPMTNVYTVIFMAPFLTAILASLFMADAYRCGHGSASRSVSLVS